MVAPLTLIALVAVAYALVSRRLGSTIITAPIFFAGLGFLAGPVLGIVDIEPDDELLVLLLEAALVMVLFADASSLDIRRWTREPSLSGRLLGIGLPLTMIAGALIAWLLLPGIELWQAALVGVILAPTDAALGQAVVANPRVPAVVRNALNVESGLNDGLALPFVTIFITVGVVAGGAETELQAIEILALALVGSTVIGLVMGLAGGRLIRIAADRGLADPRWLPIGLVALAIATFSIADGVEASGFLAVWVAGIATGAMVRDHVEEEVFHLPEQAADALAAIGFLLLGVGLAGPIVQRADARDRHLRRAEPDDRPDPPRRRGAGAQRAVPGHRRLRRLVRAAGSRVDRVRRGRRGGRRPEPDGRHRRRAADGDLQPRRPRCHGRVGSRPVRRVVRAGGGRRSGDPRGRHTRGAEPEGAAPEARRLNADDVPSGAHAGEFHLAWVMPQTPVRRFDGRYRAPRCTRRLADAAMGSWTGQRPRRPAAHVNRRTQ